MQTEGVFLFLSLYLFFPASELAEAIEPLIGHLQLGDERTREKGP